LLDFFGLRTGLAAGFAVDLGARKSCVAIFSNLSVA
jgi:hypothetical protein